MDNLDMSEDYILMQQIIAEYDLTIPKIALESGYGDSTVYRFSCGGATIPSIIWRTLYRLTKDQRIIRLVIGDLAIAVVELPTTKLALDAPTLKKQIDDQKQFLQCQEHILEIIADGKVDHNDRHQVELYNKTFPEMIRSQYQTSLAINREYEGNQ